MALTKYTVKSLKALKTQKGYPNNIKNDFIRHVCEFDDYSGSFKRFGDDDVLFYHGRIDGKTLISIDRKTIQKLISRTKTRFKDYPGKKSDAISTAISKLTGKSKDQQEPYKSIVLEKMKGDSVENDTSLRQDFTCFCCRYFFTATGRDRDPFVFYRKLLEGELTIDSKLDLSKTRNISDFNRYLYPNLVEDLLDSVATAMTITVNKNKLKIKGSLANYTIAEESSKLGKSFKEDRFKVIKRNEKNYYAAADKLTTADIFLYNPQGMAPDDDANNVQDFNDFKRQKNLTHNKYVEYMNKAMNSGYIIPISLKKLEKKDINRLGIVSSKVSIINSIGNEKNAYNEKIVDPFLKKVIQILNIDNKADFIKELKKVINIKKETIKLNMYGTRATFDFEAEFKGENKETYDVFIQNNQIYIKPPGSSSNSGLGGVTLEYIKKHIIRQYPRGNYFDVLLNTRKYAFDQAFNYTYNLINDRLSDKVPAIKINGKTEAAKSRLIRIIKEYNLMEKKFKKEFNTLKPNKNYPEGKQDIKTPLDLFKTDCINRIKLTDKKKEKREREELNGVLQRKTKFSDVLDVMAKRTKGGKYTEKDLKDIVDKSRIVEQYKMIPVLKMKKIMSPSDYATVFEQIDENQRDEIAIRYIKVLEYGIEKAVKTDFFDNQKFYEERFEKEKDGKMVKLTPVERNKLIYSKLSTIEFLYYIGCNERILLEWIKNAVIMGIYGVASASGVIIMNGKNINEGKFGVDAIKRRNAMYVKIGK